jgi:muramidase (phage lysozyme)
MQIGIPSGLPVKWFTFNQVSEKTWIILKAKLTGKKQPDGKSYYSEVRLSDKEADTIIRNIKKDSRGFPLFEEEKSKKFEEENKKYQEWLVEQYLKNEPDIPSLEDSIKNKREEPTTPTSEPIYEGTRGGDLVDEEIDPDLLKLIGMDDVSEGDYEDYRDLISQSLLEGSWSNGKKIPKKHLKILQKELYRVKDKVGKFKLKKSGKINATNVRAVTSAPRARVQPESLVTEQPKPEQQKSDDLLKHVVSINRSVSKILEILTERSKLDKKREDSERKQAEVLRRQKREESLETGIGKVASAAAGLLAPVQGILDKIIRFIVFTLLGKAFVNFVKWLNNPQNKERVETLKKFLKDWWPALMGAIVLFTTPFGKFVRAFIGMVAKLTLRLSKFAIPGLMKLIAKYPKTAIAIGAAGAAAGVGMYMQSRTQKQDQELQSADPNYGKSPSPQKSMLDTTSSRGIPAFKGGGLIPLARAFTGGGQQTYLQPFEGGFVDDSTGLTVTGAGADTQATVLQPGEVVFSKKAVDYWGADRLLAMNKMGGGTNIPKFVNNVQMAQGGGMIGGMMRGIGRLFGSKNPTPQTTIKPSWHGPAPNYEYKSREVQAFLRSLKVAEGTIKSKNSYDTIYGGAEVPIRQMTVKELINMQMSDMLPKRLGGGRAPWPSGRSRASGAYQFMPNTLKQLMVMNVLKPSDKMTPETQDRAAWELAKRRGVTLSQLKTQGLSRGILNSVAGEWSSLPNLEGKSYYNQPVKKPELLQQVYKESLQLAPQAKMQLPGPPTANQKISFVDLPPITQQANQQVASSGGTKIPQFVPPDSTQASINASIYGLG